MATTTTDRLSGTPTRRVTDRLPGASLPLPPSGSSAPVTYHILGF